MAPFATSCTMAHQVVETPCRWLIAMADIEARLMRVGIPLCHQLPIGHVGFSLPGGGGQ